MSRKEIRETKHLEGKKREDTNRTSQHKMKTNIGMRKHKER